MQNKERIELNPDNINISFAGGAEAPKRREPKSNTYKILIADDDEEIHKMTRLVLKGFKMEGGTLEFLDSYSGQETIEIMKTNSDIAIVLLDVVMEESNSGLKVVQYIREVLKNNITRIILRTGQPGAAPEEKVIVEYEIDDYKAKSDLTVQKLISTMYVCLRAHKNIRALNKHKEGLNRVIHASNDMYKYHSFTEFLNGMLHEVIALYDVDLDDFYSREEAYTMDGMAFIKIMDSAKILAGTGKYEHLVGTPLVLEDLHPDLKQLIETMETANEYEKVLRNGSYLGIFKQSVDQMVKNYIILETDSSSENMELIRLFLTNFSLAIDNFTLTLNSNETQSEIIYRISEIVENRCDSTANHLRRVSKITRLLAEKIGFTDDAANALGLACVMHDVGKIGIPDSILLKPGKLTMEEFEVMKTHTTIGNNIFRDSRLPLLNLSAKIALYHHERYDGKGYPEGRQGKDIPQECAIVTVADVFDALLSKRCYKEKWSLEDTLEYFMQERGKQFAPDVVDVLMENLNTVLDIMEKLPD